MGYCRAASARYVKLNTSRIEGSSDLVANVRIGISFISVGNAKNNLMAQQASGHGGRCVVV